MARPQMGTIHFFGERLGIRGYQVHPNNAKDLSRSLKLKRALDRAVAQSLRGLAELHPKRKRSNMIARISLAAGGCQALNPEFPNPKALGSSTPSKGGLRLTGRRAWGLRDSRIAHDVDQRVTRSPPAVVFTVGYLEDPNRLWKCDGNWL